MEVCNSVPHSKSYKLFNKARGQTGCVWENGRRADPIELCSFLTEYLHFILEAMGSPRKVLSKIIS